MFEDLTIVIKTFIRYKALKNTIEEFKKIYPELKFVVVDDTPLEYRKTVSIKNVKMVVTDPDIGLSAGRNLGFREAETDYIFYADDDCVPVMTREDMEENLNYVRSGECDLIGSKAGKFRFNIDNTVTILMKKNLTEVTKSDYTDNFYIAKKEFLVDNPYFEPCKITGEHFAFFFDIHKIGGVVFSSPTMVFNNSKNNPEGYNKYRKRNYKHITHEYTGVKGFNWKPFNW